MSVILVTAGILVMLVGDMFTEQTSICDTLADVVSIFEEHRGKDIYQGFEDADRVFYKSEKAGVCRVSSGPLQVMSVKGYSLILNDGRELSSAKVLTSDGKTQWAMFIDVDIKP